jgi:hypothetical protein
MKTVFKLNSAEAYLLEGKKVVALEKSQSGKAYDLCGM